jgi:hypothetical protein
MSPSLPLLGTSTARSGPIAIASHASAPRDPGPKPPAHDHRNPPPLETPDDGGIIYQNRIDFAGLSFRNPQEPLVAGACQAPTTENIAEYLA